MDATPSGHAFPDAPATARGAVCLVLVAPDAPRPEPLIQGLRKRAARTAVLTHPAQVMVQLASTPRAAVIVDRSSWLAPVDPLHRAITRYYPHATCWIYDKTPGNGSGGGNRGGRLSQAPNPHDARSLDTPPTDDTINAQPTPRPTTHGLRLADRNPAPHPPAQQGPQLHRPHTNSTNPDEPETYEGQSGTTHVVSAEELAMLMAPDPDDPEPTP